MSAFDVLWWCIRYAWWHHQMETFSASLAICAGNSRLPGEFPAQRTVTQSFDVFFDLCLNKWLSKQSWVWWFETLSRPLWCTRNGWHYVPWLILSNQLFRMWLSFALSDMTCSQVAAWIFYGLPWICVIFVYPHNLITNNLYNIIYIYEQ